MAAAQSKKPIVTTAAGTLVAQKFSSLTGLRIGLIVNHTSLVDGKHLVDLVDGAANVKLAAILTPEHGLRGTADAGEHVSGGRDTKTGAPIYSLYGKTRKPTRAMLKNIDALLFDIQDIGARFYTYISTMGLAMQAAAKAGIPFYVADRPNPLGGLNVSGFMLKPKYRSFVGQFEIPITHGMTIGELAAMIKGEKLLPGLAKLDLRILKMTGWQRSMLWPDTGLAWVKTSPAIPDFDNALAYPGMALFEASSINFGRGTDEPFKIIGAPWINAKALAETLNNARLPGVQFTALTYMPKPVPNSVRAPKFMGVTIPGVRLTITNPHTFQPVETGIALLCATYRQARAKKRRLISRRKWLALMAGTHQLYGLLGRADCARAAVNIWQVDIKRFTARSRPYRLY